jgi:hypothetical protein
LLAGDSDQHLLSIIQSSSSVHRKSPSRYATHHLHAPQMKVIQI